jgi:hypothetical protein
MWGRTAQRIFRLNTPSTRTINGIQFDNRYFTETQQTPERGRIRIRTIPYRVTTPENNYEEIPLYNSDDEWENPLFFPESPIDNKKEFWKDEDEKEDKECEECSICNYKHKQIELECKHKICINCKEKLKKCPYCRTSISDKAESVKDK